MLQLAFVAAHVPLAMAIPRRSPLLGFHALLVLGLGLIAAVIPRKQHLAAYAAAYITGAAVFWRMRAAPIPWEFGKYAIVVIFFAALVVTVGVRRPFLPIAYFALLVPSAFLTVTSTPWPVAREMLSFNLSGPLALAMSVLFFSSVALSPARMQWLLVCLLAPVVGTATVAATGLKAALRSAEFEYGATSSVAASGGFGPNQVSAILGFGIVAILVFFVLGRASRVVMGAMLLVMLFLAAQCLLTLSRGGIYMAMGAVGAASFYLMRERRSRLRVLLAGAVVGAIFVLIVIPRLEGLTGGVVVSRFGNTSGTGRELLVLADLKTWSENPVLGIGPGLGGPNRLKYFSVGSAHTEYTRLLAEHGLLGLISLGLLGAMAVRNFRSQRTTRGRAISAALLAYALLFMVVDAMRLGAPAFAFGLSGVTVVAARRRRLTQAEPRRIPVPGAARAS